AGALSRGGCGHDAGGQGGSWDAALASCWWSRGGCWWSRGGCGWIGGSCGWAARRLWVESPEAVNGVAEAVGGVAEAVGGVAEAVGGVAEAVGGVERLWVEPAEAVGGVAEAVGGVAEAVGGVAEAVGGVAEAVGGVAEAVGGVAEAVGGVAEAVGRCNGGQGIFAEAEVLLLKGGRRILTEELPAGGCAVKRWEEGKDAGRGCAAVERGGQGCWPRGAAGRGCAAVRAEGKDAGRGVFNVLLTCGVIMLLVGWSFTFSKDANRLLITPIEYMTTYIRAVAEDPLGKAHDIRSIHPHQDHHRLETDRVLMCIYKIIMLLRVGLGEAGLGIIAANLNDEEGFNPMIPGVKVRACFGFCDIRQFTDTTEILEEEVIFFVNNIAEIVHSQVVQTLGAPNKNIGDAFLCVWKQTEMELLEPDKAQVTFADRALVAWLKVIMLLSTSESLAQYSRNKKLLERIPDYQVKMGFGLHVGWAIEGAIGSCHKVDPSYLSPHVNMAARLEAATKQYGVMILLSEQFHANLRSTECLLSCRKIDRITVKGSSQPTVLYTYDIGSSQATLQGSYQEYKDKFECAVDLYIAGKWPRAMMLLEQCLLMWPTDHPAKVLHQYMMEHVAKPRNWPGYRELSEK
ncbi:hypothetical protein CYMTET_29284, partial [Cymbomonas tetramitiformis]